MKIGELARATQTQAETIRFYEREGLLPAAPRTESNYRSYGQTHVERLTLIRRCRALDMNLDEIRALLEVWDAQGAECGEVNALLDEHINHVTQRIKELEALRIELKALRARCGSAAAVGDCGILQGLIEASAESRRAKPGHVGASHVRSR